MSIRNEMTNTEGPCCFCQKPTRYWTMEGNREWRYQVACCTPCAVRMRPVQVPSWQAWMDLRMARALPVTMRVNSEAVRKLFRPGGATQ